MALEASGLPKFGSLDGFGPTPYRILPRSSDAESVYSVLRRRPILGGIVLRAERVELGQGLVGPDRLGDDRVELRDRVLGEDVRPYTCLNSVCVGPRLDLLDHERGIPTVDRGWIPFVEMLAISFGSMKGCLAWCGSSGS